MALEKPKILQSWIDMHYPVPNRKRGSSTEFAEKNGVPKQLVTTWKKNIVYKGVMYSPRRRVLKRNETLE